MLLFANAMTNSPRTVPNVNLPTNLRSALDQADRTQEWLAREIGVSLRQVQKYVAGNAEPSGGRLVAMANALGKDAGWFYLDHSLAEEAA